jgi:hypothetical protein
MGYEKKSRKKKIQAGADIPSTVDNDKEWETRQDLDAVVRHHAVKKDPERMQRVKHLAARKLEENKGKLAEAKHAISLGKEG